jgi:hypothetical protein
VGVAATALAFTATEPDLKIVEVGCATTASMKLPAVVVLGPTTGGILTQIVVPVPLHTPPVPLVVQVPEKPLAAAALQAAVRAEDFDWL